MLFTVNGKSVDFTLALPFAKPWDQWTMGEKRLLDRLGFNLMNRDPTREGFIADDLFALVVFFAMKANRRVIPADFDRLTEAEFGKIALPWAEQFAPLIWPKQEAPAESETEAERPGDGLSPFPDGGGELSTSSPIESDGVLTSSSA